MLSRTTETMVIVLAVIMLAGTLTLLIVSAIQLEILKRLDERVEPKEQYFSKTEYEEFPFAIDQLRLESEDAMYKKCIAEVMKAKENGHNHCYLLSSEKAPLPKWIADKLMSYGLDLTMHQYKSHSDYWCEAYWDDTASGKIREWEKPF